MWLHLPLDSPGQMLNKARQQQHSLDKPQVTVKLRKPLIEVLLDSLCTGIVKACENALTIIIGKGCACFRPR